MQPQTLDLLFEQAKSRAKAAPEDLPARSALWQIFAARGEYERARRQLDVLAKLDTTWLIEVQACHGLIEAELRRQSVFAGRQPPACLGQPPAWFAQIAAALKCLGEERKDAALPLLVDAWNSGEACPCSINGQRFEWVRDGDARIGRCLEVIVQGRYFWAPWECVMKLEMRPPSEIRDRLWQPATIQVSEEGPIEAFIPVRYPDPRSDDEMLARRTEWVDIGEDLYLGYGQKCLVTDSDPVGYLDVRELTITPRRPAAGAA